MSQSQGTTAISILLASEKGKMHSLQNLYAKVDGRTRETRRHMENP